MNDIAAIGYFLQIGCSPIDAEVRAGLLFSQTGVVTSGTVWRFLQLTRHVVSI
jgi:hypothetical protein